MATLKEAVESGRRWKFKRMAPWLGPGWKDTSGFTLTLEQALGDDWEIEPEPEKPREWYAHYRTHVVSAGIVTCAMLDGPPIAGRVRVHDADACDRIPCVNCGWNKSKRAL